MTLCNMAIEAGARAGLIGVDETTVAYVKGRPFAPQGEDIDKAAAVWRELRSDANAQFDVVVELDATAIKPQVTWGTSPEMTLPVNALVPDPEQENDPVKKEGMIRALQYMDLKPGVHITDIRVDKVFVGSCTNGRIEDLRAAAEVAKGKKKAASVKLVLVVPGSGLVKRQAEEEGLDRIFKDADFEWREPGCSMCLAMNADRLEPGERCASTSNRNFEGRQGFGGRTHLVSPAMAAAAAIYGHFVDVSKLEEPVPRVHPNPDSAAAHAQQSKAKAAATPPAAKPKEAGKAAAPNPGKPKTAGKPASSAPQRGKPKGKKKP